jgi:hypothetical protein
MAQQVNVILIFDIIFGTLHDFINFDFFKNLKEGGRCLACSFPHPHPSGQLAPTVKRRVPKPTSQPTNKPTIRRKISATATGTYSGSN